MAGPGEQQQEAIEAAQAEVRRLRLENWRLSAELRRELSQEASVGQLHCQRMATSGQQPRQEADASAGAPLPAEGGAADAVQSSVAEAEGKSKRLQEEVTTLKSSLRDPMDLQALEREVGRMRQLLAQPEEAWHVSGPLLSDDGVDEAADDRPQGSGEDSCGVLLNEVSFEMLASLGEVELAEEKKALQQEVRGLQAELARVKPRPAVRRAVASKPAPVDVPSLRQRRRLQQMDAIAQRLHQEFRQRSAAKLPEGSPPTARPPAATPVRDVEASLDLRGQLLEEKIKALSQRFLLIRDLC